MDRDLAPLAEVLQQINDVVTERETAVEAQKAAEARLSTLIKDNTCLAEAKRIKSTLHDVWHSEHLFGPDQTPRTVDVRRLLDQAETLVKKLEAYNGR